MSLRWSPAARPSCGGTTAHFRKTQIATAALAAHYSALLAAVAGTTLGMHLADLPAVFLGDAVVRRVPLRIVRGIAAAVFAGLGLLTLLNVGNFFYEQAADRGT